MPLKELERIQAVNRFLKLEISKEKELQDIVKLAAEICQTDVALITLISEDTQHIRFKLGTDLSTTNRNDAFCNHAIQQQGILMVPDAVNDVRFVNNPLVTDGPNIRFYAGAPLTTSDGHMLGSLCVIDRSPKELTKSQQQMLEILARQVITLLEFDISLKILKEQFLEAESSANKLRSFFESSSSCHLLIDRQLEVVAFNKALSHFIKGIYHVDVVVGMRVTDYISEAYIADFVSNYNKALSGHPVQVERHVRYNNKDIWWYITYDPAFGTDREIIGVSFNLTDITQQVINQQQLILKDESLRKIAYIQSHEVRRPVASIMGLMNLFKMENYTATRDELLMMETAVEELDEKVRLMVNYTSNEALFQ